MEGRRSRRGRRYQFLVNTCSSSGGNLCFLCSLPNNNYSNSSNGINNNKEDLYSLKFLARYLKFDFGKVLLLSSSPPSTSSSSSPSFPNVLSQLAVENAELDVPLCASCSSMVREFNELYGELELVRIQLEAVVRQVGGVMEESAGRKRKDNNKTTTTTTTVVKHNKYPPRRRVVVTQKSTTSPSELVAVATASSAVVTDKLREEMFEKCVNVGKNLLPKVQLDNRRLVEETPTTTPSSTAVDELFLASIGVVASSAQEEEEEGEGKLQGPADSPNNVHDDGNSSQMDDEVVTFTRLSKGRRRCNLCSKTLQSGSTIAVHRNWHTGARPYQCEHCAESFPYKTSVWLHRLKVHPATFFSSQEDQDYRDPMRISKLLDSLTRRKALQRDFQCPFCPKRIGNGDKYRLHGHMIAHHMSQLEARLRSLQQSDTNDDDENTTAVIVKTETAETEATVYDDDENYDDHDLPSKVVDVDDNPVDDDDDDDEEAPAPILLTTVSADKHNITFTKLENGGFRCSLCSKIIYTPTGVKFHRFGHTGEKPIQCDQCERTFRYRINLRDHSIAAHLPAILASHQDSRLSSKQFELVVGQLFSSSGIRLPLLPGGGYGGGGGRRRQPLRKYKCCFCDTFTDHMKIRAHGHIVEKHMDELTPRLRELQQQEILAKGAMPPPRVSKIKPRKRSSNSATTPSQTTSSAVMVKKRPRQPSLEPLEKVIYCEYCNSPFLHQDHYRNHAVRHHNFQIFQAYHKPQVRTDKFLELINQAVKDHIQKTGGGDGGGVIGCTICPDLFPTQELAEAHVVFSHQADIGRVVEQAQKEQEEVVMMMMSQEENKPEPEPSSRPPGLIGGDKNDDDDEGGGDLLADISMILGISS